MIFIKANNIEKHVTPVISHGRGGANPLLLITWPLKKNLKLFNQIIN